MAPAAVESMCWAGEKPWHNLGVELKEVFTSEQAIKAAKMDFQYELEEIRTVTGIPLPEKRAIVRHRQGQKPNVTGVASPSYVIHQPKECFRFFDSLVGQKLAIYQTAGVLLEGARIWLLAKLPGEMRILRDDVVEKYVLLTTGFDGITATTLMETPVRTVCLNTLLAALAGLKNEVHIQIRHRGDLKSHLAEAQRLLKISVKYYSSIEESFKAMAGFTMKSIHVKKLFDTVLPVADERKAETSKGNAGIRERILHLAEKGRGMDLAGVRGTAWGMYNAFVEYADFYRKTKVIGVEKPTDLQYKEARLTANWMGLGRHLKEKTFSTLMEMVGKPKAAAN